MQSIEKFVTWRAQSLILRRPFIVIAPKRHTFTTKVERLQKLAAGARREFDREVKSPLGQLSCCSRSEFFSRSKYNLTSVLLGQKLLLAQKSESAFRALHLDRPRSGGLPT